MVVRVPSLQVVVPSLAEPALSQKVPSAELAPSLMVPFQGLAPSPLLVPSRMGLVLSPQAFQVVLGPFRKAVPCPTGVPSLLEKFYLPELSCQAPCLRVAPCLPLFPCLARGSFQQQEVVEETAPPLQLWWAPAVLQMAAPCLAPCCQELWPVLREA